MKSIRLSLIVYFLVLITGALGAISAVVYHTTARTLQERQAEARNLVAAQFADRRDEVYAALDKRVLRQAQTLATMARTLTVHYEVLYPLGVLGAAPQPDGYLGVPYWLAPWLNDRVRGTMFGPSVFKRRPQIDIENADDLLPGPELNHAQEYFQVFSRGQQPLMRSKTLGEHQLDLDPAVANESELFREYFDTVELESGVRVRRVTLKSSVTRFHSSSLPWPWRFGVPTGKAGGMRGPSSPSQPPPLFFRGESPVIFIQYASDLAPTEARVRELERERDQQVAQVDAEIEQNLATLRRRLAAVVLGTFIAVVAGGYVLLRLGLAPLSRLSDAVSKVTARDFRLKIDVQNLPNELRPIAERMSQTLDQLQQAFDREKQAAADISHDLRTPLASLLTTIEVALKRSRSVEEYREVLEECRSSGRQMSQMVERLLALARLDAGADRGRLRDADVTEVALNAAEMIRPLADARGLRLRIQLEPELTAHTDPDKVREVLTNLLHNAVEYNRPGGSVELVLRRDGAGFALEVRDTGVGIPAEALPRIFERFYRADPSRHADTPHSGLGLAIVKGYVDLLGGTVSVQSSPAGTTFIVRLPARTTAIKKLVPA